jgi:hypothetical protein
MKNQMQIIGVWQQNTVNEQGIEYWNLYIHGVIVKEHTCERYVSLIDVTESFFGDWWQTNLIHTKTENIIVTGVLK